MSAWFQTYGFAEINDQFLIGAYPLDERDVAMLEWAGVQRVLNLCDEDEYRPGERVGVTASLAGAGIEEHRIPLTDYGGLPTPALEAAVQEILSWLDEGHRTYLHCRAGWQRSAAVAAGVVAVREGLDIDEALGYVQRRKPSADPLPHQREDLKRWWTERAAGATQPPAADAP